MVIRNDGSIILDTLIRLEYDNQTGEAEFEDRGLYLDEYDLHLEVLEIKKV